MMPRAASISSTMRRPSGNRKYSQIAWLMISAGKRWPAYGERAGVVIPLGYPAHSATASPSARNLTVLVDCFTAWEDVMPDKMEQAILAGRGVLPLSRTELARVHPSLWATAREVDNWRSRKGTQNPIRYSYWKVSTLSSATEVTYR